jgi:hypothetical protein
MTDGHRNMDPVHYLDTAELDSWDNMVHAPDILVGD